MTNPISQSREVCDAILKSFPTQDAYQLHEKVQNQVHKEVNLSTLKIDPKVLEQYGEKDLAVLATAFEHLGRPDLAEKCSELFDMKVGGIVLLSKGQSEKLCDEILSSPHVKRESDLQRVTQGNVNRLFGVVNRALTTVGQLFGYKNVNISQLHLDLDALKKYKGKDLLTLATIFDQLEKSTLASECLKLFEEDISNSELDISSMVTRSEHGLDVKENEFLHKKKKLVNENTLMRQEREYALDYAARAFGCSKEDLDTDTDIISIYNKEGTERLFYQDILEQEKILVPKTALKGRESVVSDYVKEYIKAKGNYSENSDEWVWDVYEVFIPSKNDKDKDLVFSYADILRTKNQL